MPDTRIRYEILRWPVIAIAIFTALLMIRDNRIVFLAIWGAGAVLVYGRVFMRRRARWRKYHDPRSFRDLVTAVALLLTAGCVALAVAMLLFGIAGTGIRGFTVALAMGSFVAAGLVMDDEEPDIR